MDPTEWYEDGEYWHSEAFGDAHRGRSRALLADGSVPGPVYFDAGSGGGGQSLDSWWVYDGRLHAPKAEAVCAGCACGWLGAGRLALDWGRITDLRHVSVEALREEWTVHLADVGERAAPIPQDVDGLLTELVGKLWDLADENPLPALRIVAVLERLGKDINRQAASRVEIEGEASWRGIATALGTTESEARSRVRHWSYRF
jgi:hypothetical protein